MGTLSQNTYGKLYIKKRSFSEWLIFMILVFPFVFGFLSEVLSVPSFIRYSLDLFLAYFFIVFITKRFFSVRRNIVPLLKFVLIFFIYTLVVYCFNYQTPFYYLWGLRNNFRFYIAFFAFVIYVSEDFAYSLLKLIDVLFWLNIIVSIVQFIFLDIKQDDLGGLFGSTGGTNAYTLLFFSIVISKSLLTTLNGTENTFYCISKCVASLVVCAMAEMKFYYVVFIILFFLASVLTHFSKRKLALLIIVSIAVIIGSALLTYLFDEFENFLTLQGIWDAATKEHYSSQDDINRLSAIAILMKNYITEPAQQIFGLGLGNCDVSDVVIFNSTFYQNYSFLHYTWFSSAMLFMETGFIGLGIYLTFFIICFRYSYHQIKVNAGNKLFCQMAIIMSVLCVILVFYNSSLRIESGYMAYFVLSLPFLSKNGHGDMLVKNI